MSIPKIIFFDLGDVVCHFVPERRIKTLSERTGRSAQDLLTLFWSSGFSGRCDAGEYTSDQMRSFINTELELELSEAELAKIWQLAFEQNTEVCKIARKVSAQVKVAMLTNNPPILRNALPVWFPEIESLFDPILFSYELLATKPNAELFARVEDRIALHGSEILLIDDSPRNVEAAWGAGWQAIRFVDATDLISSLEELGFF